MLRRSDLKYNGASLSAQASEGRDFPTLQQLEVADKIARYVRLQLEEAT